MVPNANESHLVQILVWSHCSCCSSAARLMSWCLLSCYIHGSCAAPICHALRLLCVAFFGLLLLVLVGQKISVGKTCYFL